MSEPRNCDLLLEAMQKHRRQPRRVPVPDSVRSEQLCMIEYLKGLGLDPFQILEVLPLIDLRHMAERYQVLEELALTKIDVGLESD